jgi:hypothetical protein
MMTRPAAADIIGGNAARGAIMSADHKAPKDEARKQREDRLAAELRENLRKRKAQASARKNAASTPAGEDS